MLKAINYSDDVALLFSLLLLYNFYTLINMKNLFYFLSIIALVAAAPSKNVKVHRLGGVGDVCKGNDCQEGLECIENTKTSTLECAKPLEQAEEEDPTDQSDDEAPADQSGDEVDTTDDESPTVKSSSVAEPTDSTTDETPADNTDDEAPTDNTDDETPTDTSDDEDVPEAPAAKPTTKPTTKPALHLDPVMSYPPKHGKHATT